eukprot:1105757-Pyramimonas_sp.AAC.1
MFSKNSCLIRRVLLCVCCFSSPLAQVRESIKRQLNLSNAAHRITDVDQIVDVALTEWKKENEVQRILAVEHFVKYEAEHPDGVTT